ncbi:MAG: hypothetical protein J6I85_02855 [Clostridia bacterium]|nr:hypothetical protein [Clostridia bacterium]
MYNYKISKYKIENRKEIINEWTSISDIGKEYNGKEFKYEDYIKTENAYIEIIFMFIKLNNIKKITIDELEKYNDDKLIYDEYDFQIQKLIRKLKNKMELEICDIELYIRAILREQIWAKLYSSDELYIHFGYDYYMYIGSKVEPKKEIKEIEKSGLVIERQISPYL